MHADADTAPRARDLATGREEPSAAPPGPGRASLRGAGTLAGLQSAAWLEEVAGGHQFGFLLLTHPPARRCGETAEGLERDLRDLGTRLGLAPENADQVPRLGDVLTLVHGLALLDVGGLYLKLCQPRADWGDHVADGGPVLVMLGLDPLPVQTAATVDDYVTRAALNQRAMAGIAFGHRTTPAAAAAALRRTDFPQPLQPSDRTPHRTSRPARATALLKRGIAS